ncbi:MAG: hypothetical protein AABX17_01055 [Nanoarchaeota archaeon]
MVIAVEREPETDDNIPEGELEVLLTGLEVDSKGNLVARFRNYGAVYFPDWEHRFVTKMLGRNRDKGKAEEKRNKRYAEVVQQIAKNEKLTDYEKKEKKLYWWVYQVKCPVSLKDELPEEFIRGHYTQQARWRLCSPGNFVTLDRTTAYALKRERQIEKQLEFFSSRVSEQKKGNNLTIAVNDINQIFEGYHGTNWAEIRAKIKAKKNLVKLDEEILLARKEVADQIIISNQRLEGKAQIVYGPEAKNSREYTLRTIQTVDKTDRKWREKPRPWKFLTKSRTPSAQEFFDKKWMALDIEIPYFRRDKPEITWIGVSYIEKGVKRKVIHTTHNLGVDEINGFRIVHHKNESELISRLTEEVKKENPDFISAYNARFDLIKLRESLAGFPIGDEDSDPLYKVTTKFFERIGIKDRLVIDPLPESKIAAPYNPNNKMEMTAGFEKEISYDDMEKLEEESLGGKKESGQTIARYLSADVDNLTDKIIFHQRFKNDLEDALKLSEIYGIGIERLLHSANCVNDVQEKGYFSALGVYREEVPPHLRTKKMQQLKTAARETFKKYAIQQPLEELAKGKSGLFEDVYKVYVPYGDFFREALAVRFPDIKKFLELKDSRREDKKRLFFLEQYGKEFARWICEDSGFFVKELRKYDKLLRKTNKEEFEIAYKNFKTHLAKDSEWGAVHFDKGTLGAEAVQKHATPELRSFLERNNMDFKQFVEFSNQRIRVKRRWKNVIGNYRVAPSLRFSDEERSYTETIILDELISRRLGKIKRFITDENLEVVGHEGSYLYVRGNKSALLKREAPVVLVDEIPWLYVADNAYYKKFGFYSHLKLKEEPDYHLTMFEMKAFREILDNLLEGKNSEAMKVYERELEKITSGKVTSLELLFYNKNKTRYSAFSPHSNRKDGRIYFMTKAPEEDVKEDERGKYIEVKEKKETLRVDIRDAESISLDYDKYTERFRERAEAILKPISGVQMELDLKNL